MNAHTTETPVGPAALPAEVERLETLVQSRLHGRVRNFRVVVRGGGVILTGQSHTYYVKQLAQHAVLEASALPILANEIQVS
jgi:hypothetical protein